MASVAAIPSIESEVYSEELLKSKEQIMKGGEAITKSGLFTPEATPAPELPKETDDANTRKTRINENIERIQKHEAPLLVLGVRTTQDFRTRVPNLKSALEKEKSKAAKDALKKVQKAETQAIQNFLNPAIIAIKRTKSNQDEDLSDLLRWKNAAEKKILMQQWDKFLDPDWNQEEGADEARKIYDDLKKKDAGQGQGEDVEMHNHEVLPPSSIEPDDFVRSLYLKATRYVKTLLNNDDEDDFLSDEKEKLEAINVEIDEHGEQEEWSEDDISALQIRTEEIIGMTSISKRWLKDFREDSDPTARDKLTRINENLAAFNTLHHYPKNWLIDLPSALLRELLGSNPVSTSIDVPNEAGFSADGEKILRYSTFFANTDNPYYRFLSMKDGRYYLRPGKEVMSQVAAKAHAKEKKNLKMGEYYGEHTEMGINVQYSKKYFNKLRKMEEDEGEEEKYIRFMGAFRKGPTTTTGRTLPPEGCIIYINDPEIGKEWYDVFTRSTWTKFYGRDAAGRFNYYWGQLGEEPSSRDELGGRPRKSKQSSATSEPERDTLREEVKELRENQKKIEAKLTSFDRMDKRMDRIEKMMMEMMNEMKNKG